MVISEGRSGRIPITVPAEGVNHYFCTTVSIFYIHYKNHNPRTCVTAGFSITKLMAVKCLRQLRVFPVVWGYLPLLSSRQCLASVLWALRPSTDVVLFGKNVLFRERAYAASGGLCLYWFVLHMPYQILISHPLTPCSISRRVYTQCSMHFLVFLKWHLWKIWPYLFTYTFSITFIFFFAFKERLQCLFFLTIQLWDGFQTGLWRIGYPL